MALLQIVIWPGLDVGRRFRTRVRVQSLLRGLRSSARVGDWRIGARNTLTGFWWSGGWVRARRAFQIGMSFTQGTMALRRSPSGRASRWGAVFGLVCVSERAALPMSGAKLEFERLCQPSFGRPRGRWVVRASVAFEELGGLGFTGFW